MDVQNRLFTWSTSSAAGGGKCIKSLIGESLRFRSDFAFANPGKQAKAPEEKARAAAQTLPVSDQLATKEDILALRTLLEDWRSVVVTRAELHRSQRELKADLNAERWRSTVVQIVATVALVVALVRFL